MNTQNMPDLEEKIKDLFVGRDAEIRVFLNLFALEFGEVASPKGQQKQVLNIFGQDGIGKTWLCHRLALAARETGALSAVCDGFNLMPVDVMEAISVQFAAQGHPLSLFDERLQKVRTLYKQIETDARKPEGFVVITGRRCIPQAAPQEEETDTDEVYGNHSPAAENAENMEEETSGENDSEESSISVKSNLDIALDSQRIEDVLACMPNASDSYIARKFQNPDQIQLLTHAEQKLTHAFLEDVRKLSEHKRISMLLDDFELNSETLEPWLKDLLGGKYGEPPPFVLVVSGQEALNHDHWQAAIEPMPLRFFSDREANLYLKKRGVKDSKDQAAIRKLSEQLPVWMAVLTAGDLHKAPKGVNVEKTALAFFLNRVLPESLNGCIQDAALPRTFNEEILVHLAGEEEGKKLANWLSSCAFVKKENAGWRFHPFFRAQLVQKKYHEELSSWNERHKKLADYFQEKQPGNILDESAHLKSDKLQSLARENIYHLLCSHGPKHLPQALNDFIELLHVNLDYAKRWASVIRDAGKDTYNGGLFRWGQRLSNGIRALDDERYSITAGMITSLLQYPGTEKSLLAKLYSWSGELNRLRGFQREARRDLNLVLEDNPDDPVILALRGESFRLDGAWEEAVEDFNKAIELTPEYVFPYTRRGIIYLQMVLYEEALKDFHKVVDLDPGYAGGYVLYGEAQNRLGHRSEAREIFSYAYDLESDCTVAVACRGQTFLEEGMNEEALRDFEMAVEKDPDWAWAIASRGLTYKRMDLNEYALRDFNRALEIYPDISWGLANRAMILRQIDRVEDALKDVSHAIRLSPKDAPLYALRGEIQQRLGNYVESLADFNKSIELDPNFVGSIAGRGTTYRRMQNFAEALIDFSRAAELDPGLVAAVANQGETYRKMGKFEEALECFSHAIGLRPDYAWAIAGRGGTYRMMGRFNEAIEDFSRSIELNPNDTWVLTSRGMTYRLMEKYEEAIKDFDRALKLDSNQQGVFAARGEVHRRLQHLNEALRDFTRAIELNPADNWSYSSRGEVFYRLKRTTEALADFNHAIIIQHDDIWALMQRGKIYREMKRYSKAIDDFGIVLDRNPQDDELRYIRGLLYQYTGDEGRAITDFETAVEVANQAYEQEPAEVYNQLRLGLYKLTTRNYYAAKDLFEQALAKLPSHEYIRDFIDKIDDLLFVSPESRPVQEVRGLLAEYLKQD